MAMTEESGGWAGGCSNSSTEQEHLMRRSPPYAGGSLHASFAAFSLEDAKASPGLRRHDDDVAHSLSISVRGTSRLYDAQFVLQHLTSKYEDGFPVHGVSLGDVVFSQSVWESSSLFHGNPESDAYLHLYKLWLDGQKSHAASCQPNIPPHSNLRLKLLCFLLDLQAYKSNERARARIGHYPLMVPQQVFSSPFYFTETEADGFITPNGRRLVDVLAHILVAMEQEEICITHILVPRLLGISQQEMGSREVGSFQKKFSKEFLKKVKKSKVT